MQTTPWQKSTYSGDSSNCVYIAASTPDKIHLRESDEPDIILTTTATGLRALIHGLKEYPELFHA